MFSILGGLGGGALGMAGSLMSGFGTSRRAARERRRTRELLAWASQEGEKMTQKILTSPSWSALEEWATGMFEQPVPDWMAKEAADRLRVAQTARGLAYGATPGLQEAFELTAMSEKRREALAPWMSEIAMAPLSVGQRAFDYYLGRTGLNYGITNLGPSPLEIAGQALASGVGGFLGGGQALGQLGGGGGAIGPATAFGAAGGFGAGQMANALLAGGGMPIRDYALASAGLPSNFPLAPWEVIPFGGTQGGGDYYRQRNVTYQDLVDLYKKGKLTGKI